MQEMFGDQAEPNEDHAGPRDGADGSGCTGSRLEDGPGELSHESVEDAAGRGEEQAEEGKLRGERSLRPRVGELRQQCDE